MFQTEIYSQMFIEFDESNIHIDIHLIEFCKENVNSILETYVEKYRNKKISRLHISFWDTAIAGDYLSLYRKDSANIYLKKPLNGYKYIRAHYNYVNTRKQIGNVSIVN